MDPTDQAVLRKELDSFTVLPRGLRLMQIIDLPSADAGQLMRELQEAESPCREVGCVVR